MLRQMQKISKGMESKLMVLLLALAATAYVCFHHDRAFLGAQEQRPRMIAGENEFDFGSVSQWDILEHTFVLQNDGQGALKIEDVSPD